MKTIIIGLLIVILSNGCSTNTTSPSVISIVAPNAGEAPDEPTPSDGNNPPNGGGGGGGSGSPNTGGGGVGGTAAGASTPGGSGGSGIVILSIPSIYYSGIVTGSPTVNTINNPGYTILTYTQSGSYLA